MHRTVNDESRRVNVERRLVDQIAVEVDLDQAGCGDFVKHEPKRIEQEMLFLAGHARRYVGKHELAPSVVVGEAVEAGELDPPFPFLIADPPADVRGVG